MKNFGKFIPWILLVILGGIFGYTWKSMDSEIEKKTIELADIKGKYDQLVSESNVKLKLAEQEKSRLVAEASKEKINLVTQAEQEKSKLIAEANEKLQLASQPEVQIQIGFRKALLNSGNVAVLKSRARESIAITLEVTRPSSGSRRSFELILDSNQVKEIGAREGWAFVAGDMLRVSQSNHKAVEVVSQ